eukprot:TRINITY_DN1122_c0_g1_i1.p1 TRINITY_DN1122_c0_g1~~TRINITY_DN1122_c0_g1_i1.p1  ORF type:complete len:225 (+),score=45.79 TRINITY_DN1122_c0_g1_i1:265-939(+)
MDSLSTTSTGRAWSSKGCVSTAFQGTRSVGICKALPLQNYLNFSKRRSKIKALKSTGEVADSGVAIPELVSKQGSRIVGVGKYPATTAEFPTDAIAFDTLKAEITKETEDDCDLDVPSKGFCSIPDAIKAISEGKLVIAVDDEDRENEGDLIMAASSVTPEAMAFMVKHGTGIVCVAMKEHDLNRLNLPLMISDKENEEKLLTAFTVSVVCKIMYIALPFATLS